MIKRLPRYAETKLQSLCAEAGALCHKVDEDESGWDFLVELPEKPFNGPLDSMPPGSTAYVQVKSTRTSELSCRIKLSNALRAARSPQPWFIVFIFARPKSPQVKVYAVHFWDDLIARTLKAVRRAEADGRPLNRASLLVRFRPSDDKTVGLVQWMQHSIDAIKPTYSEAKQKLSNTVGFEAGFGEGLFRIEARTEEEIIRNFLGLGDGLRINQFTLTSSRFGIAAAKPEVDVSEGTLHITPTAVADIEMRFRSHAASEPIIMRGKAYVMNIPGAGEAYKRMRFSAKFIELIWQIGGHTDFSLSFDHRAKHDLATIEEYVTLNDWFAEGPVDVQVWMDGKRAYAGALKMNCAKPGNWQEGVAALRLLRAIAGAQSEERVRVSLYDIAMARGSETFPKIYSAPSIHVEFTATDDAPGKVTSVVYWSHLDVAEHAFYGLFEHPVREDARVGNKRHVTGGAARILESYVLTNPGASDREMIRHDYDRHITRLDQGGNPLMLGDLREFIASAAAERQAAAKDSVPRAD